MKGQIQEFELNDDIKFVLKAVCKDKDNPNLLDVCHVKENAIYMTDGHRIHYCNLEETIQLDEGLYKISLSKTSLVLRPHDGKFIDFSKLFNEILHDEIKPLRIISFNGVHKDNNLSQTLYSIYNKGICINYKYLKDALSSKGQEFNFYIKDKGTAIKFISDDKSLGGVIMPLRVT